MSLLGVLVTASFILFLPWFIPIFLPQYLPVIGVVQVLSLAIPFMFVHVPLAQVLLSSDRYLKSLIFLSSIPVAFNIILNLILIPTGGYMAAAWITVFSDILSLGLLLVVINRYFYVEKN